MEVLNGLVDSIPFATLLSLFAGMFWLGRTLATKNDMKDLKKELLEESSKGHAVIEKHIDSIEKHIDSLHDDIREMRNMMRGT